MGGRTGAVCGEQAVYGLLTLIFVPWAILTANVDQALWAYVVVDALFEAGVLAILVRSERAWRRATQPRGG